MTDVTERSPERTYAVVVGIERYEAGSDWNLDGAASSALRIIKWLRQRDVPAPNITVLLSPLEANQPAVQQTMADLEFPPDHVLPATVDAIRDVVTEQLPLKDGDLLVLFWSGHGVLGQEGQRLLFCANAGANAKYNINVSNLLTALSGNHFVGLGEQVIIVDACANFIQEMRLNLNAPRSEFAVGTHRHVERYGLLAAAQGERALLDPEVSFGHVVADWLDQHAQTLPPAMDQLAAEVVERFKQLQADGVTEQHPVVIQDILHGNERNHEFGGAPVPEKVLQAARSADLTTAQLRATAAAIAAMPQLATQEGREALMKALEGMVGPLPRTDDRAGDLLDLVGAVFKHRAQDALFRALLSLAANGRERLAAEEVRRRWELQSAVVPLLPILRRTSIVYVLGALSATAGGVHEGITDFDDIVDLLAGLDTAGAAVSPLAEFVVRLQHRQPDVEIPDGWFPSQGMDEAAVAALRARVAKEAEIRRRLVINLSGSTPEAWQSALTGYIRPGWFSHTARCEPTADGVRGAVVELVEWAQSQAADFDIGFLLGLSMLRELPELWEYRDTFLSTTTRLCEEYPVVLHAAERMTVRKLQEVWSAKLTAIEASAGAAPSVLWVDQDDATAVRRAVQRSDKAFVAFSFVPQARPATAMMAAIAAGAPYVIWVQAAPAGDYDLRTQLGAMVGPVRDFPATLLQRRQSDPYLCDALRVIWDNPDDLPPYVTLGEELTSNG